MHDQQKAKEFEETHLDVNTSLEIFSKRIYHSTNSVTHTESNQQHTIFFCIVGQQMPSVVLPLC